MVSQPLPVCTQIGKLQYERSLQGVLVLFKEKSGIEEVKLFEVFLSFQLHSLLLLTPVKMTLRFAC